VAGTRHPRLIDRDRRRSDAGSKEAAPWTRGPKQGAWSYSWRLSPSATSWDAPSPGCC